MSRLRLGHGWQAFVPTKPLTDGLGNYISGCKQQIPVSRLSEERAVSDPSDRYSGTVYIYPCKRGGVLDRSVEELKEGEKREENKNE